MSKEITFDSELIYDGRIMQVYKDDVILENGKHAVREYVHHNGGASILAADEDDNVYLVTQFRYPYRREVWEIPAGKLEKGEDPLSCAVRELEEETGLKAEHFTLIAELYPTPAYTDERLYVYLATGLTATKSHLDEDEFLSVKKIPLRDALKMAEKGELHDGKTLVALYYYAAKKAAEN